MKTNLIKLSVFILACLPVPILAKPAPNAIPVVVSAQARPAERAAAEELAGYLGRIYPGERFTVAKQLPPSGRAILVGSVAGEPRLKGLLDSLPTEPESFVVATARGGELGVIAGADSRGVVYGVYGLLEKLGCGFYLSYETVAPARKEPLSFEGWQLANRPMVKERLMLNWHNFLSGCSTYNLEDWNAWTLQSQKLGYNGILLHCYGNNPMISYTFNGKTKPVGYLSTSVKGRDWFTMHVNDVRKIWGGEVFSSPVFGADAGLVPDEQRVAAARKLMGQVFEYAKNRSMDVFLAMDVDTLFALPQELILTLPESARFASTDQMSYANSTRIPPKVWIPNPDTPEGYKFYRTQIEAVMKAYPQITTLIAWFRVYTDKTALLNLKVEQMPAEWQQQYKAEMARNPEVAQYEITPAMFAASRIVRAYQRAMKELGHEKVDVAVGSWRFKYGRAANYFLPKAVKMFALNFEIYNGKRPEDEQMDVSRLPALGSQRPLIPIFWAHHDDGAYIGRAYPPTEKLYSRLKEANASGFGINHWTSRPLDLFLVAQIKQVWNNSLDQPLLPICEEFAERSFGAGAKEIMAKYLQKWATGAPAFGRDTMDRFQTEPLKNVEAKIKGCKERIKLLDTVDLKQMTPEQQNRWKYFRSLEEYIIAFHEDHPKFEKAEKLWKEGDYDAAVEVLSQSRPEPIIEQFARFSSLGGMTMGEKGLVISMNTRWLSHYVRLRQALGMEPIRYQFGPTSHDPIAQGEGRFTFFFDNQRRLWQTLGEKATGAETFTRDAETTDITRSGIQSDKPIRLALEPIMYPAPFGPRPGRYNLRLTMLDPSSTAVGQRVFDVSVRTQAVGETYSFEPVRAAYLRLSFSGTETQPVSIKEVYLSSLKREEGVARVTAANAAKDHPAENVLDSSADSAWTSAGPERWLQFRLDPQAQTSEIKVLWSGKQPPFELQVSDDGQSWRKIEHHTVAAAEKTAESKPDRVDIFQLAGGANRVLIRNYPHPITAKPWEKVELILTPVTGKAVLCAAELEPVDIQNGR